MRNILAHVPQKQKSTFASERKTIWLAPSDSVARERAQALIKKYKNRFSKAMECLEEGLEDSLTFYGYPELDQRKVASGNMIERLNRKIRRRTAVVGIFPNEASYVRLVTSYLMEYSEDWTTSRSYIQKAAISAMLNIQAALFLHLNGGLLRTILVNGKTAEASRPYRIRRKDHEKQVRKNSRPGDGKT